MRTVLIEWADAIGPVNTAWTALSEINRKLSPVKVVGFVLHEDAESVTLIMQVDDAPEPGLTERIASHDMTVPRGCIKRMVDLVEVPPSKSAGGRSGRSSRKGGSSRGTGR